jgi:hypothetical protein
MRRYSFFLNLYKATLLCLSVVYMGVESVYGCVQLCGEKVQLHLLPRSSAGAQSRAFLQSR